jgi:hypothetical protein
VLLDTLVKNYSTGLNPELLAPVLAELPPLVSESGKAHAPRIQKSTESAEKIIL